MKLTKNLGMLVLAIFLILSGLRDFLSIGALAQLLPILAIAAGVLILVGR